MRSYARNIATTATMRTIRDDIALGDADASISEKTISQYLVALDRMFVWKIFLPGIPRCDPRRRSEVQ